MKKKLRAMLLAGALLALAAGIGYAAIPAADGTISACKNSKGTLKVIDVEAGQACPDGQQLLTWNQQGQQGPAGTDGVSGYELVTQTLPANAADTKGMVVYCPAGKVPVGGGGEASVLGAAMVKSYPRLNLDPGTGWQVAFEETIPTDAAWSFSGFAVCVNAA
jgi:hypothetical protein